MIIESNHPHFTKIEQTFIERINCNGCGLLFPVSEINKYKGDSLCSDCLGAWTFEDWKAEKEKQFQESLNKQPSDELMAMYTAFESKNPILAEYGDLVKLWKNRIKIALGQDSNRK